MAVELLFSTKVNTPGGVWLRYRPGTFLTEQTGQIPDTAK
jgi:hypothetical protein